MVTYYENKPVESPSNVDNVSHLPLVGEIVGGGDLPQLKQVNKPLRELTPNLKKKRGRPPHHKGNKTTAVIYKELTPEILDTIEDAASRGLTNQEIAAYLNIGSSTFYSYRNSEPAFAQAVEKGRAKANYQVANKLIKKAIAGDTIAGIFYLKCRAGWKEQSEVKHTGEVRLILDRQDSEA